MAIEWDDGRVMDFNNEDDTGYQKNIQLAYALTIHKTQGSEFPIVVVVCYKSHSHMLHRNLLYTAVTRARESCVIVGDMAGIKIAVEKTGQNKRNTFLPLLINSENP
jgi:exodeoxyribonuclease V alpha subunit